MSLRADQLKKLGGSRAALDAIVREQLAMIDSRIQNSDRVFGRNVVHIDLGTSFSIPGLSKMDEQRFVYSSIISSLIKRGFEVRIVLEEDNTTLLVIYTIEFGQADVDQMNKVIRGCSLRRDQVEEYCKKGAPS